jgi:DNA-binding NarL/FixJ family response regulator
MEAAPLAESAVHATRAEALLVSDEPGLHLAGARLLAAGGFTVTRLLTGNGAGGDHGGELLVLALGVDADARIDAIARAVERRPGVPIVTTMPSDASATVLRRALRAGADGIVLDHELGWTLVATARAVLAGQLAVPSSLRRRLAPRALSHREKQILGLVVRGYTNRQIADTLFVAESTVKTHLSAAFAKLEVRSRSEAAALILDPDEGEGLGILTIPEDRPSGSR